MITNKERLSIYLDNLINSIFKILPLYEEKNEGIVSYVESLLFEMYGLEKTLPISQSYEYISLLSTIESLKKEIEKRSDNKRVVKREVFKSISIVKNIKDKIDKE